MGKDVPQLPGEGREPAPRQGPLGDASSPVLEKQSSGSPSPSTRVFPFCHLGGELLHPEGLAGMG